jgi:predicted nuclease of restriction endonuclease-like (RecB) superfamily
MKFDLLVKTIQDTHTFLQHSAVKAVNKHLTIRNWLIGFYIVEFEQKGEDKATYGEKLIPRLSDSLSDKGLTSVNERELRRYRTFYLTYPALDVVFTDADIWGTLSPVLPDKSIWGTLSPETKSSTLSLSPQKLLDQLSFSHLAELIEIEDAMKRAFYEIECIKGGWSVRELKRQINSLYFERMGLSNNPEKMSQLVAEKVEKASPEDVVKSHFAFEFLGISTKTMVEESDLEQAILDHLQDFLLEMGRGFCFEARQKRLLIGEEYFFVDLVMYHRILKCHVIIELKADKFNHSHLAQLNTYVNYYKKNIQEESDNPPIGILLVVDKNEPLVEYALAGIDNQLFVRKYLLELPNKEKLKDFIINEIKRQE